MVKTTYAVASVVSCSVLGAALAALALAFRPDLFLALPNDPRARLPFAVLLSPRPMYGSFRIFYLITCFVPMKTPHFTD